ncbi:hypothetical protein FRC11_006830 [Ceratobasidium sp. 423]|nr:hypothetical protein FRC11_006830 [Ceratobasidium sp. 423]
MRVNVLASFVLALLPLVPAATTRVKGGDIEARADNPLLNTSDSMSLASNDGSVTPASSDGERRACPGGYGGDSAALTGGVAIRVTTVPGPATATSGAAPMGRSVGAELGKRYIILL